ncbi:diguanylate cyclase domain-containing protein [Aliikangiella sp. IMCC44359]|uniref:diguanylate cyclase domain-containing protein n=1 Tax=Aliikangiella sp. IMCC44359 TaxID=3459125 RepID=UPI00403AB9D2
MSFDQTELFDKSPLGIVICDIHQRIIWCNKRFLSDTSLEEAQVVGQLYPALPMEAVDKDAQLVQLFNNNGDTKFQYWHEDLTQPVGAKAHYFTKERQKEDKLGMTAARLTTKKLPKRANWVEFLDYEVSRSRRYDNPLSILKLHLVFYHLPESVSENTLLQTVKDTLADQLRWADMIGHTDQGSYLLVLPETPEDSLKSLQEKISIALKRQMEFISKDIKYKVVYGRACWQKHDDSQKLLKKARQKLVKNLEKLLDQK